MTDALAAAMKATLVERRRQALESQRHRLARMRDRLGELEDEIQITVAIINAIKHLQHENGDPQ